MPTAFLGALALALAERWNGELDVTVSEDRRGLEIGLVFCPSAGRPSAVVILPLDWERIAFDDPAFVAWEVADDAVHELRSLYQMSQA